METTGNNEQEKITATNSPETESANTGTSVSAEEQFPVYSGYGYMLSESGNVPTIGVKKQKIDYELQKRKDRIDAGTGQQAQTQNQANDDVSTYGDLITKNLANQLVKAFIEYFPEKVEKAFMNALRDKILLTDEQIKQVAGEVTKELSEIQIYKATFSKEVLTMLLSQPNCAGIKFYYCMGLAKDNFNQPKPSLVLVGVNNNDQDLNSQGKHGSIIKIEEVVERDTEARMVAAKQQTLVYEVGGVDGKSIETLDQKLDTFFHKVSSNKS
jgi:hypothetical protein